MRTAAGSGCALAVTALLASCGGSGPASSTGSASSCPSAQGSEVARVAPAALGSLRTSVAGVLPGRIGRLYEEGPVRAAAAWSDMRPLAPAVSPTAPRPASYEMRWWSPNRDDIVADVFVFADTATAQRFAERALSMRCRSSAGHAAASHPPQAGNLKWRNPEGFVQADVYLVRGARVYRVADVPASGSDRPSSARGLQRAFYTIDALACLIPKAGCGAIDHAAPV